MATYTLIDNTNIVATNQSSVYAGNTAAKMFDGLLAAGQYWLTASGAVLPQWASWDYGSNAVGIVGQYEMQCNSIPEPLRMPKDWTLQGSANNVDWDIIDTVTGETAWAGSEKRLYTCDVITTQYRYYRVVVTANNGDAYTQIGELYLYAVVGATPQVIAALDQRYDLRGTAVLAALAQEYNLMLAVANGLDQKWGMILEQVLTQYYDDAPLVAAGLGQHWGNSPLIMQGLDQKWDDALQVAAVLLQKYNLMYAPVSGLEQRWEICGAQAMAGLGQVWDIRAVTEIMAALGQYWGLYRNGAVVQAPVFSVMADGILLSPSSFSWTLAEGSHSLEASVVLPSQAQYNSIQHHGHLEISWNGRVYEFFIESKNRSRTVSDEEFRVDYTLSCLSLTAGLDAPYSFPMTRSWENTMMASAIVIELADGIPVDWQIADFSVPGNSFFANNETPLAVIKKLVGGSVEAIVQTSHDGTIIVRREFPVSPAKWLETPADYTISDDGGVFTDSEVDDIEGIYNMVTVTDRMESDESLRLEQELVSVYEKIVCGYQVPWAGDFVLRTSGGLWVDILDDEIVEEEITETVEFVDGAGRTAKPVYLSDVLGKAHPLQVSWLHTQLGSVTSAEDGSLASEVVGNSLAEITYLTRFRKWRVINRRKVEKVQCFVEVVE